MSFKIQLAESVAMKTEFSTFTILEQAERTSTHKPLFRHFAPLPSVISIIAQSPMIQRLQLVVYSYLSALYSYL